MVDRRPAADRGRLTVADVVLAKIVLAAALDVDGVVRSGESVGDRIGSLMRSDADLGSSYPRAKVASLGGVAHVVDVSVAVDWPSPITRVCSNVRARIGDDLDRFTGHRPARINVAVAEVVPRSDRPRRGHTLLPDPPPVEATS